MRRTRCQRTATYLGAGAVVLASLGHLEGQVPNSSAAMLGIGDNGVALARGYEAMAWNPAGLAMPDNPGSSFALFAVRGVGGLGPVGLDELNRFEGRLVPEDVRREWRDWIISEGGEQGSVGADITFLAAHAGRFGVQLATSAQLIGEIGPGAAELILFGNAGLTGEPADYVFDGGTLDLVVASTLAVGYAHPVLELNDGGLTVGATLKYTVGHVMVTAENAGSELTSDPLSVRIDFPLAQTDTLPSLDRLNQGSGVGLDVGASWENGPVRLGASIQNVFNTFAWNRGTMFFRPGQALVTSDETTTEFDPLGFDGAPASLRDRVEDLEYATTVRVGAAYDLRTDLRAVGSVRGRIGDGQPFEPAFHLGGGVEYRVLDWLPVRAGAAFVSDGYLLSGGVGLHVGVVRLDAALATRRREFGTGSIAMFTFSSESRN